MPNRVISLTGKIMRRSFLVALLAPPLLLCIHCAFYPETPHHRFTYYSVGVVEFIILISVFIAVRQLRKLEIYQASLIRDRDLFFGMVAHDLKTPLASIKLSAGVVLRKFPETEKQVHVIDNSVRILTKLIDDLNTVAKIHAGKYQLEFKSANSVEMVQEVVAMFADCLAKKNIRVINEVVDFNCVCDPERIKQVLFNLVGNSIKYVLQQGTIHIRGFEKRGCAFFEVSDNGVGIEQSKLSKIFEPYVQAHQNDSLTGSGLGLAIVRSIVDAHKGRVWAHSEIGVGSTFKFFIKCKPDMKDDIV